MAISRNLMERQLRAGGGIMTLEEPRQGYFLGKIVKKAKKAVKKVVKSPVGKAAILAGLGAYAGGLGPFANIKGAGFAKPFFGGLKTGFLNPLMQGPMSTRSGGIGKFIGQYIRNNPGKSALLGLGATAIAAPFFMGGEEEVEEEVPFSSPMASVEAIRDQARQYYGDPTNSALYFMPPKSAVRSSFYAADGGRAGYRLGGSAFGLPGLAAKGVAKMTDLVKSGVGKVKSLFDDADINLSIRDEDVMTDAGLQAQATGLDVFVTPKSKKATKVMEDLIDEGYNIAKEADGTYSVSSIDEGALDIIAKRLRLGGEDIDDFMKSYEDYQGGLRSTGSEEDMIYEALRQRKADGGLMDLGGYEKDYREGGFVPLGAEERADDVPARLSKNEFVFTADAVRNAGGGDIDKGAEVMQNMMDNLEAGGTISEESQGKNPAQAMFDQAQQLESRIA
jgi:hypothetical protein